VAADARQFGGDALGGQNKIDRTSRDRAQRHGGPLGSLRILSERNAARHLYRLQSKRSIRSRAGKDDANRRIPPLLGQRYRKLVNRVV
jgi:hypothetical protein